MILILALVLCGGARAQFGASQDELDLFDLVEEVGANFYDFIGVPQDIARTLI